MVASLEELPEWLRLYCSRAPAEEVAKAWKEGLSEEARKEAEVDAPTARARLRRLIIDCERPEVRADAADGFKYTGSILRAADAVLGIPPPKSRAIAGASGPAASGSTAPAVSREIVHGEGRPGTLGLWWSDFGGASNLEQLRRCGITRRLNVAAEAVGRLPHDDAIPVADVPMEDIFDEERAASAMQIWLRQLGEVLAQLRAWCKEGQVVNINCQMGKNRSGVSVLIWLCTECGWELEKAVEHLRKVTALALANPHIVKAATEFLQVDVQVPLNPAGDGGGWVCISPPGSPRAGGTQDFEDRARQAMAQQGGASPGTLADKLEGVRIVREQEMEPVEEEDADVVPILGELSDVD